MNKPYGFKDNNDGTFTVMIDCCSNSILSELINPEIPFIWSVNHFLEDHYTWIKRKINLSKDGPLHDVLIRNASFEFMMETEKYLASINEFQHQGNILLQCYHIVPQSLVYFKLPEAQRRRILLQNGIYSEFYLPHEYETASFTCVDQSYVEVIIDKLNMESGQQKH
jgi:hypothetical protein